MFQLAEMAMPQEIFQKDRRPLRGAGSFMGEIPVYTQDVTPPGPTEGLTTLEYLPTLLLIKDSAQGI